MEKIEINKLMSGEKVFEDIEIIRDYVPIAEKMNFGRQVADLSYVNDEYDHFNYLLLVYDVLIASYTNISIERISEDIFDYITIHPEILRLLPEDADRYVSIIESCLAEKRENSATDKIVRDSVERISKGFNSLMRSTTKAIEKVDVEKTGNAIGVILTKLIEKMPDFNDAQSLDRATSFLKNIKNIKGE